MNVCLRTCLFIQKENKCPNHMLMFKCINICPLIYESTQTIQEYNIQDFFNLSQNSWKVMGQHYVSKIGLLCRC